jgi:membrane-bound serine protease (ClpP class)
MSISPIVLIALLISLSFCAFLIYIILLSRHRKAGMSTLSPLGMSARVESPLSPEGAILLNGELWRARLYSSSKVIIAGSSVRIVGVSGHLLLVEQAD